MMSRAVRTTGRRPLRSSIWSSFFVVCLLAAGPAAAKHSGAKGKAAKPAAPEPKAEAEDAPEAPLTETQKQFRTINWTHGPAKVSISDLAELQVPECYSYSSSSGAQKLLELMHNPTNGKELGILTDSTLEIFLLFEFSDIGYVKDAEKEKLDAKEILDSIKEGNESSNEERKKRGWPPITITGWHTPPFYNR